MSIVLLKVNHIVAVHARKWEYETVAPDTPAGNAVMPERDRLSEAFLCYRLVKMKPVAGFLNVQWGFDNLDSPASWMNFKCWSCWIDNSMVTINSD